MKKALATALLVILAISIFTITSFAATKDVTLIDEGFENGIPNGWINTNEGSVSTDVWVYKTEAYDGISAKTGNGYLLSDAFSDDMACFIAYLATTEVDLSDATSAKLTLSYNIPYDNQCGFVALVSDGANDEGEELFDEIDFEASNGWETMTVEIPSEFLKDGVKIIFRAWFDDSEQFYLDDVKLVKTVEAKTYSVSYKFESATEGKTLPKEVTNLLPAAKDYDDGSTITPTFAQSVTVDGGKWVVAKKDAKDAVNGADVTNTYYWEFVADETPTGDEDPAGEDPTTGDATQIGALVCLMAVAGTGAVVLKKKEF